MDQFLRIALPIYFVLYLGIAFIAKSIIVAKRIGKNPLVLPKDDSAYGLLGRYFKVTMVLLFIYIFLFGLVSDSHEFFMPLRLFNESLSPYLGLSFLAFSLIWTIVAQSHMKDSWQIGIDHLTKTALITTGLFRYSRNPIFLGLMLSMAGLLLVTPNVMTLIFYIVSYILIQVQIRLEEEFLEGVYGQEYLNYKAGVRRFL